jgi:hypothetical protein
MVIFNSYVKLSEGRVQYQIFRPQIPENFDCFLRVLWFFTKESGSVYRQTPQSLVQGSFFVPIKSVLFSNRPRFAGHGRPFSCWEGLSLSRTDCDAIFQQLIDAYCLSTTLWTVKVASYVGHVMCASFSIWTCLNPQTYLIEVTFVESVEFRVDL